MKLYNVPVLVFTLLVVVLFSCKKDEENPKKNEENELITTVILRLTDSSGTEKTAMWRDLTPNDDMGRTIDTLLLNDSTMYSGTIVLLNETRSPADTVSNEVLEEAKDHLFVYKAVSPLTPSNFVVNRTDKDQNNLEIGLQYSLETKLAGKGGIRVILRHQPGEKNGTEAPGDSDVDVVIPVVIK